METKNKIKNKTNGSRNAAIKLDMTPVFQSGVLGTPSRCGGRPCTAGREGSGADASTQPSGISASQKPVCLNGSFSPGQSEGFLLL